MRVTMETSQKNVSEISLLQSDARRRGQRGSFLWAQPSAAAAVPAASRAEQRQRPVGEEGERGQRVVAAGRVRLISIMRWVLVDWVWLGGSKCACGSHLDMRHKRTTMRLRKTSQEFKRHQKTLIWKACLESQQENNGWNTMPRAEK